MITENDQRTRRCPILGHPINFSYCRKPGKKIPCRKIFDCWWETFDIKVFMEDNYDAETLLQIVSPHQEKMVSLFEIMKRAQERLSHKKNGNTNRGDKEN